MRHDSRRRREFYCYPNAFFYLNITLSRFTGVLPFFQSPLIKKQPNVMVDMVVLLWLAAIMVEPLTCLCTWVDVSIVECRRMSRE